MMGAQKLDQDDLEAIFWILGRLDIRYQFLDSYQFHLQDGSSYERNDHEKLLQQLKQRQLLDRLHLLLIQLLCVGGEILLKVFLRKIQLYQQYRHKLKFKNS